ncbi:MAG TPA: ABC transporter ATP-binding protein [Rhodanobacteraceae bacterium]|nr:ABC transporter ATP-binding protein [Rhodanobacteraceae bacterium]
MSSEPIITAQGLGKCYQIYESPAERLKQMLYPRVARLFGRSVEPRFTEFWALRGVDFRISRGETVGILGRNGSGKTTLLQVLCGTLPYSEGHCEVQGRVAALLELGAGFKPEFTGRENVLINSAIVGIPEAEARSRMQQVIEFSELGEVIDRPVKTYSSGMYVRLAFSAAIHVSPDILVVDEALAVGDARFQAKCFRRINEMKEQGVTILFVTHATEQVAMHCSRALLLDGGRLIDDGHPREVSNRYLDLLFGRSTADRERAEALSEASAQRARTVTNGSQSPDSDPVAEAVEAFTKDDAGADFASRTSYHAGEYRWGDGSGEIVDYLLVAGGRLDPAHLIAGEEAELYVRFRFRDAVATPVFGFFIKSIEGLMLTGCNSRDFGQGWGARYRPMQAGQTVVCKFRFRPNFDSGNYLLSLGIAADNGGELHPLDRRYDSILLKIENDGPYFGLVSVGASCDFVRSTDSK